MHNHAHPDVCPAKCVKWLNSPIRKLIQNPRKLLQDYVKPGFTAVDLGCGGGFFSVELAKLVGATGKVISVDLQPEMLEFTREYARKNGVLNRITLHPCAANDLKLDSLEADFVLAFYMVHEVPDRQRFLNQVAALLKPGGCFYWIEPSFHVKAKQFQQMLGEAQSAGLIPKIPIKRLLSRGMVFTI
ncbi:MAG: methyltransferase domain-containing protein [bacterium]|nr:methyltransferase domain-containing protein [bacterium]